MNDQIFFIVLFIFGSLAIILFGVDIFYLIKRLKEERYNTPFNWSKRFLLELEKMINQEVKKTISEMDQKIAIEVTEFYKKQMFVFSKQAKNKMNDWNKITKKEISKFSKANSQAKELMLKEAKDEIDKSSKELNKKIDGIYQVAKDIISEKIAKTEKNIEEYKKEKINELDEKIYSILGETAKKTLGKIIDLSDHEKLVVQALEKAKKEKIL